MTIDSESTSMGFTDTAEFAIGDSESDCDSSGAQARVITGTPSSGTNNTGFYISFYD